MKRNFQPWDYFSLRGVGWDHQNGIIWEKEIFHPSTLIYCACVSDSDYRIK